MTKYEELEEVDSELKLKQLLWDSIDDWDSMINEWMEVGRHHRPAFIFCEPQIRLLCKRSFTIVNIYLYSYRVF